MNASEVCPGVYLIEIDGRPRVATLQSSPGAVYGERVVGGYRIWDPGRSKLAALVLKSRRLGRPIDLGISESSKILYLGASTGTTVSHVSDMVPEGLVYAVEFSIRSMRDLLRLCESRKNIIPILADAAHPESYGRLVEPVDLVYQDVAQRNQAEIASWNSCRYLRPGHKLVLMIKSRSVDTTLPPRQVLSSELERLAGLAPEEIMDLLPYHQDHWAVVADKV
jgi:fibrillarin-like pre-rRNA processing protein